MTKAHQPSSLRAILSRFHLRITLFAVAVAGLAVFFAGLAALRGYAQDNLALTAQLAAYSAEPAIMFNDPTAAREAIAPLGDVDGVRRVVVMGADPQRPLVDWQQSTPDPAPWLSRLLFPRAVILPVRGEAGDLGSVQLWGDAGAMAGYVRVAGMAGLACLLIAALGAVLIARRFEANLAGRFDDLARVAHDVRLHRQLDRRVGPQPIVEFDRLGKDLNSLLDELQGWREADEREKQALSRRAEIDPLTGLANRAAFDREFPDAIAIARRDDRALALLFLDMDGFKQVNDQFGHSVGDQMLRATANRIAELTDDSGLAARLGGDEFAVVLTSPGDAAAPGQIVSALVHAIQQPLNIDGHSHHPHVSIGMARLGPNGDDAASLLQAADADMYRIKQHRRANLPNAGAGSFHDKG